MIKGERMEELGDKEVLAVESLEMVWRWYKRKLKKGYDSLEILEDLSEAVYLIKMVEVYGVEDIEAIKKLLKAMEEGDA